MKRLLTLVCIIAFLAALPLSHIAMAEPAEPNVKVPICHVNSANDVIEIPGFGTIVFGKVIEVDENAVAAKEAKGDSAVYWDLPEELRDYLEAALLISLPNADCYFFVAPAAP